MGLPLGGAVPIFISSYVLLASFVVYLGIGHKFFYTTEEVYVVLAELVSRQVLIDREATISALCESLSKDEAVALANELHNVLTERESKTASARVWGAMRSGFIKFPLWRPSEAFTKAIEGRLLKPILASLLWILVISAVLGFFKGIPSLPNLTQFGWQEALLLWLALTLTTAWHELGHVAVAAHFGVRTRSVGIGLFYLQPVGYADVTESWIKPAKVRVTIALGGVLFQAIPLLVAFAVWIVSQNHLLGAYTLASLIGVTLNLVPFVRLDGYWLLCHLLDQQNLRQRSLAHLRYLLTGRGQPQFAGAASGLAGVFAVFSVVFALGLYLSVLASIATALGV